MTMVKLERPTSDSSVLAAARRGLECIFRYGYAKSMAMLTDLSDPRKCQPYLLEMLNGNAARDARRGKLMALVDRINRTQGRGTLRFAAQGWKDATWHMAPAVAMKEATDGDSNWLETVSQRNACRHP